MNLNTNGENNGSHIEVTRGRRGMVYFSLIQDGSVVWRYAVNVTCPPKELIKAMDANREQLLNRMDSRIPFQVDSWKQSGSERLLAETPDEVKTGADRFLKVSHPIYELMLDFEKLGIHIFEHKLIAMALYLVGTSRLLSVPLCVSFDDVFPIEASHLLETVLQLFPKEAILYSSHINLETILNLEGSLRHKLVIGGHQSRALDAQGCDLIEILRGIRGWGWLFQLITAEESERIVTKHVIQDCPFAYLELMTDRTRSEGGPWWYLSGRDGELGRIIPKESNLYKQGPARAIHEDKVDFIVAKHHAVQRMLQVCDAFVPFIEEVAEFYDVKRFQLTAHCTLTSALLHQYQRGRDENGRVRASTEDHVLGVDISDVFDGRTLPEF